MKQKHIDLLKSRGITEEDIKNKTLKLGEWYDKCDLTDLDLSGIDLNDFSLINCDFSNSNLKNANLVSTELEDVNFIDANLEGVNLSDSYVEDVNFINTNLEGANLSGTCVVEVSLEGANLTDVNARDVTFKIVTLKNANLTNCDLTESDLKVTNLENASLIGTKLNDAKFRKANLDGVVLPPHLHKPTVKEQEDLLFTIRDIVLGNERRLDMGDWDCGTAKCLAGWAIALDPRLSDISNYYGNHHIAGYIGLGRKMAKYFYLSNEVVLKMLKELDKKTK